MPCRSFAPKGPGFYFDALRNEHASVHTTLYILPEENLGHHSLVFVIQQMTMKYRHTFDNGVGES